MIKNSVLFYKQFNSHYHRFSDDKATSTCYYVKSGVIMWKWRPPNVSADSEWEIVHQIVVPKACRKDILTVAHESSMPGHLGIRKTAARILKHFLLARNIQRGCLVLQVMSHLPTCGKTEQTRNGCTTYSSS